jgi:hypothetical protein
MPHSIQITIVKSLSHGQPIAVLYRPVGVGKKQHLAKIHGI